jgi:hypothetical protein
MALPIVLVVLTIVSSLLIGLSALSASEPTIAANQLVAAQARALAEAGVERARWALRHPGHADGIPPGGPIPAPYDGSQPLPVSSGAAVVGGFRVTVAARDTVPYPAECPAPSSMSRADRCIVAVAWAPDETARRPQARRKIVTVLSNPRLFFTDPPAALSIRGRLGLGDEALVDARSDTICGAKVGTATTALTSISGEAVEIRGATDGNDTRNEITDAAGGPLPPGARDLVTNLAGTALDPFTWTDADVDSLRRYARTYGTYRQGSQRFASGALPNGVVFIDTASGANISRAGVSPETPLSDFARVDVLDDAPADPSGIWSGLLFVNGTLAITGSVRMRGLLYAQDDLHYHGAGHVGGVMISRNIRDASAAGVDSDLLGAATLLYSCADARTGGDTLPDAWVATSRSYREICASCS